MTSDLFVSNISSYYTKNTGESVTDIKPEYIEYLSEK